MTPDPLARSRVWLRQTKSRCGLAGLLIMSLFLLVKMTTNGLGRNSFGARFELCRHRMLTHACEIMCHVVSGRRNTQHYGLPPRVCVASQNVEHRARQQNTLRTCRIAIAANTSCPPTNAESVIMRALVGIAHAQ